MTPFRRIAAITATALTFGTAAQAAGIVEIASGDQRFSALAAAVSADGTAQVATIVIADIEAGNRVIHVVDRARD